MVTHYKVLPILTPLTESLTQYQTQACIMCLGYSISSTDAT